jgi:malonyl-CoA O-methyltransferase
MSAMKIDKQRVRQHFNQHAHEYDRYAIVQQEMAESLLQQLAPLISAPQQVQRILEIGCGTGILSERLLAQFPNAQLVALDLCENMIAEASQRLAVNDHRVYWVVDDAEQWLQLQTSRFDIVISNATVQWFNEPFATMRAAYHLLNQDGVLAFSTFLPGTFHELHRSFAQAETVLGYPQRAHGQAFVSLEVWRDELQNLSPRVTCRSVERVFEYADVRQFLDSVKRVGAGNALALNHQQHQAALSKRLLAEMTHIYEQSFSANDESKAIRATYCSGFFLVKS